MSGITLLGGNVLIFIGIFLIAEAIFSIIYYFKSSTLPHSFRGIRAVLGAYLVWRGATYSIYKTIGLFWSQVAFFTIVGLSILAGYEVAKVLEKRRR
ncbi:hypothetical protein AKJ44_01330 [candidate division MSBL1 archaeon SCGC-AAA261F17]|uniref:Uncharacterized protein n=1 Tax=candidate division MSBL1 archaeon SCGC-AAA261F17 TaxID=1698274 RepID=A0A133V6R2_9EURY|nr:hypothetical protein AKJ44_01330 [candidate division MSBL1 archaeon SCGC-AAA261F17]